MHDVSTEGQPDLAPGSTAAPRAGVEGHVDGWVNGAVTGWAWLPALPRHRACLEILAGARVIGTVTADAYRGDLEASGKSDGFCGFSFRPALSPEDASGGVVRLAVRQAGGALLPGAIISLTADDLRAAAELARAPTPLPVALHDGLDCAGFIEEFGPDRILGWASRASDPSPRLVFELVEDGEVVGRFTADYWRGDLEAARQGDGRWAFAAEFPAALRNGQLRHVAVRLADSGRYVTAEPLRVRFAAGPRPPVQLRPNDADETRSTLVRPPRGDAPSGIFLSIVVVFYNMPKEAGRTLASLTRRYQQGIGALGYEVLCVDNYSVPPLEAAFVASFGPEFRLVTPSRKLASPCFAINEAAAQARGRYVAVMIDGAHVLTPGVLRETWDALTEAPDAVVGLRQYFVAGDQRWLAQIGFGAAQQDMLFDRIHWPEDGYGLFSISGPVYENGSGWLGSMSESNFLVIPKPIWDRIGGMDERFEEPGAGFANLDLFKRAAEASPEPVVALLGEASFHQFHGGTTTNVDDDEKDRRVRRYEQAYATRLGKRHAGVANTNIRLRGQLRTDRASRNRQRPPSPARIGMTDRVRQAVLPVHYDEQAVEYLTTIYAESGAYRQAQWRGAALGVAPTDAMVIQQIMTAQQPDCVLVVNAAAGMVGMVADLQALAGLGGRVVCVGEAGGRGDVTRLPLAASDMQITRAIGAAARVMVLVAPLPGDELPVAALQRYAGFVSIRAYLVVLGTALGQPWLGYSRNWYKNAVQLLEQGGQFAIDETINPHLVTLCPMGFLQRIGKVVSYSVDIFS